MSDPRRPSLNFKCASVPNLFKAPHPTTIIIPQGMLLADLNHGLSVVKMSALAATQTRQINWTPELFKGIHAINDEYCIGAIDTATFRLQMIQLLGLAPDTLAADFDLAWNAMLGDLSNFSARLTELHSLNEKKDKKIFLVSSTNPLHMNALQRAVEPEFKEDNTVTQQNPIKIKDWPLYVSYQQKNSDLAIRRSNLNILSEVVRENHLSKHHTLIVVSLKSYSPIPQTKANDEAKALAIKTWAEKHGMGIIDYDRRAPQSLLEIIRDHLNQNQPAPAPLSITRMPSSQFLPPMSPESPESPDLSPTTPSLSPR